MIFSVERDRLRERDRLARAAMSVQAEQAAAGSGPDTRHHHHHHNHGHHHHSNIHVSTPNLFRAPVRVSIFSNFILGETPVFFPPPPPRVSACYSCTAISIVFFRKYLASTRLFEEEYKKKKHVANFPSRFSVAKIFMKRVKLSCLNITLFIHTLVFM